MSKNSTTETYVFVPDPYDPSIGVMRRVDPVRLSRRGTGWYELRTGPNTFDRYDVDHITNDLGAAWFLTYPGERTPDATFDTLADARHAIAVHLVAAAKRARTLLELHNDGEL